MNKPELFTNREYITKVIICSILSGLAKLTLKCIG